MTYLSEVGDSLGAPHHTGLLRLSCKKKNIHNNTKYIMQEA